MPLTIFFSIIDWLHNSELLWMNKNNQSIIIQRKHKIFILMYDYLIEAQHVDL